MHNAPSVSYPVGRSLYAGALLALLWLLAAAATGAWWWQVAAPAGRVAAALLLLAATGAYAGSTWRRAAAGRLEWDGDHWNWSASGQRQSGTLQVALDLQHAVLLRWQADGAALQWFWLERRRDAPRWADLRRAVYSRARAPASPGTSPGAAKP